MRGSSGRSIIPMNTLSLSMSPGAGPSKLECFSSAIPTPASWARCVPRMARLRFQLGDSKVPVYVVPDRLDNREGEPNDLGEQGQMVISKYHTAPDWLQSLRRMVSFSK